MATTTTKLMTFAEFEQLPKPPEGLRQELRHGKLFQLPPAKWNHFLLQDRLRALLQNAAADTGRVATEFGFGRHRRMSTSLPMWRLPQLSGGSPPIPGVISAVHPKS